MKLKNTLLTVISSALLATSSHAVIYTDLDVINQLVTPTNPLTGYFQISEQDDDGIPDLVGYKPTEQITSATATFFLHDDGGLLGDVAPEKVTITLGPDPFMSGPVPFLFTFGGVSANALLDLTADGILAYSIVAIPNGPLSGISDFKVESALLTASVPDGGTTVLLLGMAFLGLCVLQRKFASGH